MTPGSVVVFGSFDAGLHPRVAVLRDGLAAHGWQVHELNVPLGASTADKVAAAGSPAAAVRLAGGLTRSWVKLTAGSRRLAKDPDVVIVGYMGHADVHLARALFRRSTIVLDHMVGLAETVSDRQLGQGRKVSALRRVDDAALGAADIVVVDTAQQAGQLPEGVRERAVVVPVGAGDEWRAAAERAAARRPAVRSTDEPLRVIFFGLFTPLQGAPTIGEALGRLGDLPVEVTIVGTGQDHAATRAAVGADPRVRWVDWVPAAELPDLVAAHDVCLGIFGTGPKAARVIPTKVYQGIAAGCAVVTADTPAIAPLSGTALTVPPGDPDALASMLTTLATEPEVLDMARKSSRDTAAELGPRAVTAPLAARLAERTPASAPLPPLTLNAWLRWDLIGPELERLRPQTILEIGPGEGAAACRLARLGQYTGFELSERTRAVTGAKLAAQGTPGRMVASLEELGDEQFDLVCAFEVIEHIDDDRGALAEWVSRVRPGGSLILSTPAGPDRMGAADIIVGHFRRYDGDVLSQMLGEAGLQQVRVTHSGHPFGYALEKVRNMVAARRLAAAPPMDDPDHLLAEHTEGSASYLQPPRWSGTLTRLASGPGRALQRRFPDRGTGLVAFARAPGTPRADTVTE